MTRIDPTKMEAAKEWAGDNIKAGYFPTGERIMAAAEVIASLPDEWIDADKLRELIERTPIDPQSTALDPLIKDLRALFPAPQPRTLAEMTPAEREATQWMQCEVAETENYYSGRGVILSPGDVGRATNVISEDGGWWPGIAMEAVTPLPDLPRMVWPEEHYPATDTEETPEPAQPRPEDVPKGEYWLIEHRRSGKRGPAQRDELHSAVPWSPTFGAIRLPDSDITLVSRLVPEVQA